MADSSPRFYLDHGMIHDRQTGSHVTTDDDSVFCDGRVACCALLGNNILDSGGGVVQYSSMSAPERLASKHLIAFRDLDFRRIPIVAHSSKGTPFQKMVPIGVPRIPPKILDCVCYLYGNEEDATSGDDFGGTGFLVWIPSSSHPNQGYTYVVTNHHIACTGGKPVVRVNMRDGDTEIFPYEPDQWHFDPRYDVAVTFISVSGERHKIALLPVSMLLTKEQIERDKIGVGDDVFMIGRFIDHDGGPINRPAARFGNISVMPSPIEQPNGRMTDSYCIDLHSRSGYSGSPVFIYRTPGYDLEDKLPGDMRDAKILLAGANYLGLLGIHFAQFPEQWEIAAGVTRAKSEGSSVPLVTEGRYVKGLSGMTCVLPSWVILDILNAPALVEQRQRADEVEGERQRRQGNVTPTPEV